MRLFQWHNRSCNSSYRLRYCNKLKKLLACDSAVHVATAHTACGIVTLEKKYINVELDKINSEIFDKEEEFRDLKDERARLLKIKNS